jgi:hypothetical protein
MSRLEQGDSTDNLKPAVPDSKNRPLISELFMNAEKVALALATTTFVKADGPAADPVKDSTARFNAEAEKVAKDDKLNGAQTRSLQLMGAAFFSKEKNAGTLMKKALDDLPSADRPAVLEAFQKVLQGSANDKADKKQLSVEFDGIQTPDGKATGFYTITFSGDLVCDGKGKIKFSSQDASLKAVKKDGSDLDADSVMSSRASIRDKVASGFKPEDKPAEKKEPEKPADDNAVACRAALEKRLTEIFKDNKNKDALVAAALAVFEVYKNEPGNIAKFKEFQEKYDKQTDKELAEKVRANDLTDLLNGWMLAKVGRIAPGINIAELKKTNPKEAERLEAELKVQTARDQWTKVSEGKALPSIEIPKEKPSEPKLEVGVKIDGLEPHKPEPKKPGRGREDEKAAIRYLELLADKAKLGPVDQAELKAYATYGWTGNEPVYQYARAAIRKGAELKLGKDDMATLEAELKKYVTYNINGRTDEDQKPDMAKIRKLLNLK